MWILNFSSIEEIGADVIEKFTPLAEELIESKGAKDAVAALLAIATGQTTITNHSLISGRNVSINKNIQLYLLQCITLLSNWSIFSYVEW